MQTIRTKDGIVLRNIPDDVPDEQIKARIEQIRAESAQTATSATERALGTPAARVGMGAASLIAGPFQLGANIGDKIVDLTSPDLGEPVRLTEGAKQELRARGMPVPEPYQPFRLGKMVNRGLATLNAMKERGRKSRGSTGFDWWELGGAVGSPVNMLRTGIARYAPTAAEKITQGLVGKLTGGLGTGAKIGALYGTAAPVTNGGDNYFSDKALQAGTGTVFGAAIPAAINTTRGIGHVADQFTRPAAFRNTPGNWYEKLGALPGIWKDQQGLFTEMAGNARQRIIQALSQTRPGETVPQTLARVSRETGTPVGTPFVKFGTEVAKRGSVSDEAQALAARQAGERAATLEDLAGPPGKLEAAKGVRAANAERNYGAVRNDLIDPRSNVQKLTDAADQAEQAALEREMSKAAALQDWGRFKTLEAQQAALARKYTPVPGYPRAPPRYAPHTPVSQESGRAAGEANQLAIIRRQEQDAFNDVNRTMLLNTVGEDVTGLGTFLKRPSVMKGIEDARNAALETRGYFPTQPGERFTVENLQRIKRSIAENVRMRAKEGTLGATEQKEITSTLDKFSTWLKEKSPGFRKAEEAFAAESGPINQMQIGQELQKALSKSTEASLTAPTEAAAPYLAAVRDVPRTIRRSTGVERGTQLGDYLNSTQEAGVRRVADELLTQQEIARINTGVRSQIPQLEKIVEPQIPNALVRPIMVANAALRHAAKNQLPEYEKLAYDIMKDPKALQRMLTLPESSPRRQMVEAILQRLRSQLPTQAATQETP